MNGSAPGPAPSAAIGGCQVEPRKTCACDAAAIHQSTFEIGGSSPTTANFCQAEWDRFVTVFQL